MDSTTSDSFHRLMARLETATARLEQLSSRNASPAPTSAPAAPVSTSKASEQVPSVALPTKNTDYQNQLLLPASQFLELANTVGSPLSDQAELVIQLINQQSLFIDLASKIQSPPSASDMQKLLAPQVQTMGQIADINSKNRGNKLSNNLFAIAEGINAFGWITIEKTPMGFIADMKDSAQFYVNRVLKEAKESDPQRVECARALLNVLNNLNIYVKQHHLTGLKWGYQKPALSLEAALNALSQPQAANAANAANSPSNSTTTTAGRGGPPPPPPPPPIMTLSEINAGQSAPQKDGVSALFKELNQGANITSGLKKVDKSKISTEMASKPIPKYKANSEASKTTTRTSPQKPPRKELVGKKWLVENIENDQVEIEVTDITQVVYVYNCKNATIIITNKFNTLTMDKCFKSGLVFDSIVSSCDIINCNSVQVQAKQIVPLINVDKTDGAQIFLSTESIDTVEILTAKSTEINVCYPKKDGSDEFDTTESFIPEQMSTNFANGCISTSVRQEF